MGDDGLAGAAHRAPMNFFEDGICRAYEGDPTKAMTIECLMILDRPIDRVAFRAVLLARGLRPYQRMRSRIAVGPRGHHFFEELDPEAVVDRLVHETVLDDGSWAGLQALLSLELLKPWRSDLPHWEVHIVRGLRRSASLPGETALFFRLDHSLGDGFALKNWLMSLTDEINPNALSSLWTESTDHLPQLLAKRGPGAPVADPLLKSVVAGCRSAWAMVTFVMMQVILLLPALWIAVVESELNDTHTRIKFDESHHTRTMHKEARLSSEFSLDSIRALAKSMSTPTKRCTVNDVLMGLVAGGLRGYLLTQKDPAALAPCRLRAIMVTSLREQIRSTKVEFANSLTFLPIALPVDCPSLAGRINKIKAYIDFLKKSPAPWLILRLQQVLVMLLGPAALQWKINRTQRKQTLCISNLPGPMTAVSVCGSRIARISFWVNPSNMPLMLSVLSYAGSISIMALADSQVVQDVDGLMAAVEAELAANLEKAAPFLSRNNSSASLSSLKSRESAERLADGTDHAHQGSLVRNLSRSSVASVPEDSIEDLSPVPEGELPQHMKTA